MSTALMAPRRKPIAPRGRRGACSGLVVRIAGDDAIGADQFLPNMAGEEFVSCLTCTALEAVAETAGVPGRSKLKDTRAAVVEPFADRLVLPAPGWRWRLPSGTVHRYRKNARLTTACAMSTHRPGGKWGSAARTVPRQTGKSARHASTGHALRPVQRQADDRRNRPLKPWWCTAGLSFADPHALRRRLPGPLSALCTTIPPNRRDTSVCPLGHDRRTRRLPVLRRNGRVSRRTCAMPRGV